MPVEPIPVAAEASLCSDAFLWGLDLFNHGYYWEAHEAWEGLWQVADRDGPLRMIRLVVMMYVRYPLSLRNVEDLLAERGIDISHETVRFWWNRFGPMFAAEIRKKRVAHMRHYPQWRWHLDEAFVKINGKLCYLWRAVDHEGEVLEAVVTAKKWRALAA